MSGKMRIWLTEYENPQGDQMGSTIAGATWEEAQHGCDCRGLGEKVLGELGGVIEDTPDGPITLRGTTDEDPSDDGDMSHLVACVDVKIPCGGCKRPVAEEFTVPSPVWNAVIRKGGPEQDGEYLCEACFRDRIVAYVQERLPQQASDKEA